MQALLSSEILKSILRDLDSKSLVVAARSSRALHDVAADLIWDTLSSLNPLMLLFPTDAISAAGTKEFKILRALVKSDWTRFDSYARRVRKLMHTDKPAKFALLFPAMSEAILHRSRAGLSQELLPGLTHLNWSISRSEDAQGLFHFMSRHMIHLELNITSKCPLDRLAYLSDSLQSLSPPLTTFVLVPPEDEESHTSLSKYVVGGIQLQPGIEHLKLTEAVFFTAILHPPSLNQLRSLKSLCLLQSNSSKPFDHSLPKSGLPCPDLRTLTGNGVSIWKHIVPLVGATIDTIDITNPRITTNLKDVLNIFSVIGTSCPLLSVLRLFWLDFVATTKQVEGVFRPLLRCQHLSVLVVGCGMASVDISYALSEGDFTEMGRAWPKLESLLLYGPLMKRTQHTKPPLQLRSILVLRRYCPKLQHLALSLDATNTEHPPTSFPGDTPLQTLYVGSSWINDSFAVAKWIVDLCPAIGLSSIDAVDEIPSRVQLWLEVQKAVEYIQDIRQQEKEKTKDLTRRLKSSETETAKLLAEVETLRLAYAVLAKQLHAAEGDAEGDSSDDASITQVEDMLKRLRKGRSVRCADATHAVTVKLEKS